MLRRRLIGTSLEPKTLCLTYDDGPGVTKDAGPGPRTTELAEYLSHKGISATFFMVGKNVELHPEILEDVRSRGHLVGNHTWNHYSLDDLHARGGDLISEVTRTAGIISSDEDTPILFRPPYGHFNRSVARVLRKSATVSARHVGPILWDVDGRDWKYWDQGLSAGECAARYLAEVEKVGRGIVLMHDSTADSEEIRAANRTFEVTTIIVPEFIKRGYQFRGLDSVPDIHRAILKMG